MNVTGLILAGGRASRLGGTDKGWADFQGEALVHHVMRRLAPQVGALMISANRNVEQYRRLGVPVVSDDVARFGPYPGPLAALLPAMLAARSEWLAVVPCDAPKLPLDLVARLAASTGAAPAAVARVGGRIEPLFCLLRTALCPRLTQALADGLRKPADFLQQAGAAILDFDDAAGFANLNTPADLSPH